MEKGRRKARQREEEEVTWGFPQTPRVANWQPVAKISVRLFKNNLSQTFFFFFLIRRCYPKKIRFLASLKKKKIRKSGNTGSVYSLEENLLGWTPATSAGTWAPSPPGPTAHTPAPQEVSVSLDFLHSFRCLSDPCRRVKAQCCPHCPNLPAKGKPRP